MPQQAVQGKLGRTSTLNRSCARRGTRCRSGAAVQPTAQDKCKVAINGFGRIGRTFIRAVAKRENPPLEVVAVNHTGGVKQAAHLLKYDSVLGTYEGSVETTDDETMTVDGKPVRVCGSRDPTELPWGQLGVDIVIEGTGVFVDSAGAGKHIQAGAKRVLITAPAKGDDIPTYVVGVNERDFDPNAEIVSNASCTTNCLAPYVKVLNDNFGIKEGQMSTTHSYTGDQRLLDASHRDLRRARAAALNVVPTSTGAAKAVSLALPEMKGKLDGFALRVPTPNVSLCDLTFTTEKPVTKREINEAFQNARYNDPVVAHVMDYTEQPLVSSDYILTDVSTTIDGSLTQVAPSGHLAKVVAWYDNEYGYTQRVVDLSFIMAKSLLEGGSVGSDPLEEYCRESPDAEECRVYVD